MASRAVDHDHDALQSEPGATAPRRARRHLRGRFLSHLIAIAVAAALILFGIWEVFRYSTEVENLDRKLAEVVRIQSAILETPVWNLETDRIELILKSILQDPDFVKVSVTDENGKLLGIAFNEERSAFVTKSHTIQRPTGTNVRILGELTIVATDEHIQEIVAERLQLDLALVALLIIAAVSAAYLSFRKTINLPITRLLEAIYSYRRNASPKIVEWDSEDEMGVLVSEFNALQQARQRHEEALRRSYDRLEDRVRERTAELEEARNVATAANRAKSDFLAVMSHELRTPLNGVLGLAEVLHDEQLTDTQREYVNLIRSSGESLLGLLNDILDISKIEAGSMELSYGAVDMAAFVEHSTGLWRALAAERGIGFSVSVPEPALPPLLMDELRVRQMLSNYLNNAFKFTEHGSVRLSVSAAPATEGAYELRFEVADSGIGIDPDHHDQVFNRFTQVDSSATRRFGGSGLGLAICRELAELMGGRVGLSSRRGEGSTFWFTIKAKLAPAPETAGEPATVEARRTGDGASGDGLRILLAEDNTTNQRVITAMLSALDAQITVVENGVDAVDAAREQQFDLVLMDVQMPGLDGVGATARIRDLRDPLRAATPIIALTANAMQGDRERYISAGMDDYLSKPVTKQALLDMAARYTPGTAS